MRLIRSIDEHYRLSPLTNEIQLRHVLHLRRVCHWMPRKTELYFIPISQLLILS